MQLRSSKKRKQVQMQMQMSKASPSRSICWPEDCGCDYQADDFDTSTRSPRPSPTDDDGSIPARVETGFASPIRRHKRRKRLANTALECGVHDGYAHHRAVAVLASISLCVASRLCSPKACGTNVKSTNSSSASSSRLSLRLGLLQSAVCQREDYVDETSWLTSTFIDLMLWRLATMYPDVHFLPTDFLHFSLRGERSQVCDILGRRIDYASLKPLVFVGNVGRIHWNLFRVQFRPHPELQLFEPMGLPASRQHRLSFRSIPRHLIEWLDTCYGRYKTWSRKSVSAITNQHQFSGFDCGVACLLYAKKCGQGQAREEINASIDQVAITSFRKHLQSEFELLCAQAYN